MTPVQGVEDVVPGIVNPGGPPVPPADTSAGGHPYKKKGDIFPALMGKFGDFLAIPLSNIYNEITVTRVWPKVWKEEYLSLIHI